MRGNSPTLVGRLLCCSCSCSAPAASSLEVDVAPEVEEVDVGVGRVDDEVPGSPDGAYTWGSSEIRFA